MTWESDHVESARARGVSWQHIAHQVGKCEIDIRRLYAPQEGAVAPPAAAHDPEPTEAPQYRYSPRVDRPGTGLIDHNSIRGRVLLALAGGSKLTTDEITGILRIERRKTANSLGPLMIKCVTATGPFNARRYEITEFGRQRLGLGA